MPHWLRTIAVGSAYFFFGLMGAVLAYVWVPILRALQRDAARRRESSQTVMRRWSRRFFGYCRFVRCIEARWPGDLQVPPGPLVIVANHPSLLDVIYIIGALPTVAAVAKPSLLRGPPVGPLLRTCGYVRGPDADDPASVAIALADMMRALSEGQRLVVFPEGTRSPAGELRPFRRGAFEAAFRTGTPVLPLVITVDPPMLRKDQHWFDVADEPIRFEMRPLPLVDPRAHASARDLKDHVESLYRD